MATLTSRKDYVNTEEGQSIREELRCMAADKTYNTESSYSPNSLLHPDNLITFEEKHMNYLTCHPQLDAMTYVANLRLMTRKR